MGNQRNQPVNGKASPHSAVVLNEALQLQSCGRSVIYIEPHTKFPKGNGWKEFQERPATEEKIRQWFATSPRGICIITGEVSGFIDPNGTKYGCEILDFDEPGLYEQFCEQAYFLGLDELVRKLPAETTPKGGAHTGYLCLEWKGNQKLASRDATAKELDRNPREKTKVCIETRGEGGLCVIAPTPPGIHPTVQSRGYEMIRGSWADIPIITPDERRQLLNIAQSYHTAVGPLPGEGKISLTQMTTDTTLPGGGLNNQANNQWWHEFLTKHHWTLKYTWQDVEHWQRPGKQPHEGISATLGRTGNSLYVFSTNADPIAGPRAYSPFSAYIRLEHNNKTGPAVKALANLGYGTKKKTKLKNIALNTTPIFDNTPEPSAPQEHATRKETAAVNLPLSDLTNTEELIRLHGKNLYHCDPWNTWLIWDGRYWKHDDKRAIMERAKETLRSLMKRVAQQIEVIDTLSKEENQKVTSYLKHIKVSLHANRLDGMIRLARSSVPVVPEQLDKKPWLLNCTNGTLDLCTGKLQVHKREDMLTQILPVAYDREATCPEWEKFLHYILKGNTSLIYFLQKAIGYGLTGDVREQCIFILHGSGSNGKSTLLGTLQHLMGDYAIKAPSELLMMTKNMDRHPTEKADLAGKRLVVAVETEDNKRLSEIGIKEMTGGDKIRARRMREDFWEFWPTHKILLATNHKPIIKNNDYAMWRRIRLIPFDVKIEEEQKDYNMPERLEAELPGILAWCVRGCEAWQAEGLKPPNDVLAATEEYREEMDLIGQFIDRYCIVSPEAKDTPMKLYTTYKKWCAETGEYALTQHAFGRQLSNREFKSAASNGVRMWKGIEIYDEAVHDDKLSYL